MLYPWDPIGGVSAPPTFLSNAHLRAAYPRRQQKRALMRSTTFGKWADPFLKFPSTRPKRFAIIILICLVSQLFVYQGSNHITGLQFLPSSLRDGILSFKKSFGRNHPGRVIVTGAGGRIGRELVKRLLTESTPVTALDLVFSPDDLEELYNITPSARRLLDIQLGDIRNATFLDEAVTGESEGVIHLAAMSQPRRCQRSQAACLDVNERGTLAVLEALSRQNLRDSRCRWLVLASSTQVQSLQNNTIDQNDMPNGPDAFTWSKLRAEKVMEAHVRDDRSGRLDRLDTIALRLTEVYGTVGDHDSGGIDTMVSSAMGHQHIQISPDSRPYDLLHIDDCLDAFILASQYLGKRRQQGANDEPRASFEVLDIVSDFRHTMEEVLDKIIRLTQSKSPIRYLPVTSRNLIAQPGDNSQAVLTIGFKPKVTLEEGLLRLVRSHLQKTGRVLREEIEARCPLQPPRFAEEDLLKLDGCMAHISVDVQGQLRTLYIDNSSWIAGDTMPPPTARLSVWEREGKMTLSVSDGRRNALLGFRPSNPTSAGPIDLPSIRRTYGQDDPGDSIIWEIRLDETTGRVRLSPWNSPFQLQGPSEHGGGFSLVEHDGTTWPFRIRPVCCPAKAPLPFYADDPIDYMLDLQKLSLDRPFETTSRNVVCDRLKRALSYNTNNIASLSKRSFQQPRWKESSLPRDWPVNNSLPACTNLCTLPSPCVDSRDCQCLLSTCPPPRSLPNLSARSEVTETFATPLVAMVNHSSWRDVLRPQTDTYMEAGVSIPNVLVGSRAPDDVHLFAEVSKLKGSNCFSADTSMEYALSLLTESVTESSADLLFVPFTQFRGGDGALRRAYRHNQENNAYLNSSKVIIPFSHDWGQCFLFEWTVWGVRERRQAYSNSYIDLSTAWTVMADINSPCYRPQQDIVIPPRTCKSPNLFQHFGNMSQVRPARSRRVLATFSGTLWGTGTLTRKKLMCDRIDAQSLHDLPERKLVTDHRVGALWGGLGGHKSYMALLNDTIFCPQPAGTTGWATRLVDSIYAGCIPVFIGHASQYPFYDVLDWGKLSIRIQRADIERIEEILVSRYSIEDVERLQANLMLVRDAFVYPLDDEPQHVVTEKMFANRGPLFFALHNTKMRTLTRWPIVEMEDTDGP